MDEDVLEGLIQEVVAVAAVHPDGLVHCDVRWCVNSTGCNTVVVVDQGSLVIEDASASSDRPDVDREPLEASDVHVALEIAFSKVQRDCMEATPDSCCCRDGSVATRSHIQAPAELMPSAWPRRWGPGVNLQLVIAPEPLLDPGIPLNMRTSDVSQGVDGRWQSQLQITRLPPYRLTLYSVPEYPAAALPAVILEAPWMRPEALEGAVKALKAVADELGPGVPVLLAWLDWLRGDSLEGLSELTIADGSGCAAVRMSPEGAVEQVPLDHPPTQADVLHMVLSHEARARYAEFQAATHMCEVCLEHRIGSDGVRAPCGHWHCHACMHELAAVCMRESNATGIRCPRPSCRAPLPPHVVQELLGPEELARWDELLLHKTLSSMRDVVFCPRCNLAAVESQDWAQCSGCHFAFCSLCYEAYHPGVVCATPEQRLEVLALRVQRSGNDSKVLAEAKRLKQALEDEQFVRGRSKQCPSCGAAIEKAGGCNKVVCAMCKGRMCWKCDAAIDGYEHFRAGGCVLLDAPQIMEWEHEWERMVAEHHAAAGALPPPPDGGGRRTGDAAVGARCPQCRGWCGKVARNNHLKCPWCRGDFCCLCASVLRGKAAVKNHFAKNRGCPQHS